MGKQGRHNIKKPKGFNNKKKKLEGTQDEQGDNSRKT
jgi:hypothetical protein